MFKVHQSWYYLWRKNYNFIFFTVIILKMSFCLLILYCLVSTYIKGPGWDKTTIESVTYEYCFWYSRILFLIRSCSHNMSAQNGGVQTHLPLVSPKSDILLPPLPTAVHQPWAKYYQLSGLHGRRWRKWRKTRI